MGKKRDLTGYSFGRLTVISEAGSTRQGLRWLCQCTCGKSTTVAAEAIVSSRTKSCGCLRNEKSSARQRKHGQSGSANKAYTAWAQMRRRCLVKQSANYKHYGARGITICPQWDNFAVFAQDMGVPKIGLSLERIDNNRGYSPDNCRWATQTDQQRNKRTTKLNIVDARIAKEMKALGWTNRTISNLLDIPYGAITSCTRNRTWVGV